MKMYVAATISKLEENEKKKKKVAKKDLTSDQ